MRIFSKASAKATAAALLCVGVSLTAVSASANTHESRFSVATPAAVAVRVIAAIPTIASPATWQRLAIVSQQIAAVREAELTTASIAPAVARPSLPKKAETDLLASVAIPFGRLPAVARMRPLYADMKAGLFRDCASIRCEDTRATLKAVVDNGRRAGFLTLIGAVNRSVNTLISYRRDREVNGSVDQWALPSRTVADGIGDCEDYATLKMAVLAEAGIPEKSMSLVVLRDQRRGVYHAVLSIRTNAGSYILDNLSSTVKLDSELPDYMPLYSVSAGRGFIYGRRGGDAVALAAFGSVAPGEGIEIGSRFVQTGYGPQ